MVLDTSACLDIILDTAAGRVLREQALAGDAVLAAPGLLWVEVGRVLWRKAAGGVLTHGAAGTALADFLDLGVIEAETGPLLVPAWHLRHNVTVQDGMFVALAEITGEPLLTTDLRLASAARDHVGIAVVTHLDA
jgi:predicted nucleic acid-binding protein